LALDAQLRVPPKRPHEGAVRCQKRRGRMCTGFRGHGPFQSWSHRPRSFRNITLANWRKGPSRQDQTNN
jgi:hypothetical protein